LALFATGCASSDSSGSNETAESSDVASVDAAEGEPAVDSTPPAAAVSWPAAVATFLAYDLERQVIMDHAGMLAQGDQVEQWQVRCNWIDQQAGLALGARPETPPDASTAWNDYIGSVETYWTNFQQACANSEAAALAADPSLSEHVWASYDARLDTCDVLLVSMEPLPDDAPAAYCEFPRNVNIPVESYSDLPDELASAFSGGGGGDDEDGGPPSDDHNPIDGPAEGLALLQPGSNTFEWFQPVFTINNETPWSVEAQPDRLYIANGILMEGATDEDVSAVVELTGPGGIADPDQPVTAEEWTTGPIPTIPIPDDLTEWVEAMPVVGTSTPLTIGGADATYWKLEFDRSTAGNDIIVYSWQDVDGTLWVGLDVTLHLWHVPRPDGSLLFVEMEFLGEEGPPERSAPQLFEFFSFE
jgi:hypothetical protein